MGLAGTLATALALAFLKARPGGNDPANDVTLAGSLPVCQWPDLAFEPVETFDADNLWKKINGKADFYIDSGFRALGCVRASHVSGMVFEACEYDMGTFANAFSVFSRQRRQQDRDIYRDFLEVSTDNDSLVVATSDAFFAVGGMHYLEVVCDTSGEGSCRKALSTYAECYRTLRPQWTTDLPDIRLLPTAGRKTDSLRLLHSSAFGYRDLDSVFVVWYQTPGGEAMAFVSHRADSDEAEELAGKFHEFLLDVEGRDAGTIGGIPGARLLEVMGTWSVVFRKGSNLAGVMEAPTSADAEWLALKVHDSLPKDME